jgi:hypothetical protein
MDLTTEQMTAIHEAIINENELHKAYVLIADVAHRVYRRPDHYPFWAELNDLQGTMLSIVTDGFLVRAAAWEALGVDVLAVYDPTTQKNYRARMRELLAGVPHPDPDREDSAAEAK